MAKNIGPCNFLFFLLVHLWNPPKSHQNGVDWKMGVKCRFQRCVRGMKLHQTIFFVESMNPNPLIPCTKLALSFLLSFRVKIQWEENLKWEEWEIAITTYLRCIDLNYTHLYSFICIPISFKSDFKVKKCKVVLTTN